MNELNCYIVTCGDSNGNTYEVGVMTSDGNKAMYSAENSLLEGRKIVAKAIDVRETDRI